MQGSDTLHREPLATGPMARAKKFAESIANSAKLLANHKLFRRAHTPPLPKEASMADQVFLSMSHNAVFAHRVSKLLAHIFSGALLAVHGMVHAGN